MKAGEPVLVDFYAQWCGMFSIQSHPILPPLSPPRSPNPPPSNPHQLDLTWLYQSTSYRLCLDFNKFLPHWSNEYHHTHYSYPIPHTPSHPTPSIPPQAHVRPLHQSSLPSPSNTTRSSFTRLILTVSLPLQKMKRLPLCQPLSYTSMVRSSR